MVGQTYPIYDVVMGHNKRNEIVDLLICSIVNYCFSELKRSRYKNIDY